MKHKILRIPSLVIICFIHFVGISQESNKSEIIEYYPIDEELYATILAEDKKYFDAYNSCDMDTQAHIYADDLEFYHDQGGLNNSKQEVLNSIEKNICGKVSRTLLEKTVEVYPIKDFGAVEIGYHKFFNNQEPNAESKPSRFIILWKKEGDFWKITKVISLH